MSSELHKYIENAIDKKRNLFNAEVLDFPNYKKKNSSKKIELNNKNYWNINDNSNNDQQKAVTGICLMFGFFACNRTYCKFYFNIIFNFSLLFYFPICRKSYIVNLNTASFFYNFFLFHPVPSVRSARK